MDLRKTHSQDFLFDLFLLAVAFFGAAIAWLSFGAGGGWIILGVLAMLGEALLIWGSFFELRRVKVVRYRERLRPDAKVWVRIAFLSDFHAGGYLGKEAYDRIVSEVQALHPHLVLLGGDYIVYRSEPIVDLESLRKLEAPLGKFFVLGNHDLLDRPQTIREVIAGWGYKDLSNATVRLTIQDREFEISGVDDNWVGRPKKSKRSSPEIPHLTLAHEPDMLLDLKEKETDLVLAGHTHSGQVRLPFIGPLVPIPAILGRAVDRGRKVINGVPCIISNGLGQSDSRLRLFSPPQIVIIEVGI